jgi:hypothetical protein
VDEIEYHRSLSRVVLCLRRPERPTPLFLIAVSCRHISTPVSWKSSAIELVEVTERDGERVLHVTDGRAGLELECASVMAVEGTAEFDLQ